MIRLTADELRALDELAYRNDCWRDIRSRVNAERKIGRADYGLLLRELLLKPYLRDGHELCGKHIRNVGYRDGRPTCPRCWRFAEEVVGEGGYCRAHAAEVRRQLACKR